MWGKYATDVQKSIYITLNIISELRRNVILETKMSVVCTFSRVILSCNYLNSVLAVLKI
jgi:hypothetical protein